MSILLLSLIIGRRNGDDASSGLDTQIFSNFDETTDVNAESSQRTSDRLESRKAISERVPTVLPPDIVLSIILDSSAFA